jgi:hypothetical protein
MAPTISWRIAQLERATTDGFVYTLHWTVSAVDDEFSASAYGSLGLQRPDNLVPYEQLTEETVLSWLEEAMGEEQKEATEQALLAQIAEQKAPTKATGVPWA